MPWLAPALAACCFLDGLQPGGATLDWCFAAAALLLLDRSGVRSGVAFVALTAIWCNLDATGFLAPLFAAAAALGALLDTADRGVVRERVVIALTAAAALCATPAGARFPIAAFETLRLGNSASGLVAVVPAVTAPHAYGIGLFALLVLACALGTRERGLRTALPVAVAFTLGLANGALVPIFGIVAAPVIAARIRLPRRLHVAAPLAFALAAAALVAIFGRIPSRVVPYELAARAGTGTLFCANVDWCDIALARGERVVMDGRIAPYDGPARTTQRSIMSAGLGWRGALAATGATRALVGNDTGLAVLLGAAPAWRVVARDERATLLARAP